MNISRKAEFKFLLSVILLLPEKNSILKQLHWPNDHLEDQAALIKWNPILSNIFFMSSPEEKYLTEEGIPFLFIIKL